jgi:hypothetical protein
VREEEEAATADDERAADASCARGSGGSREK